MIENEIKTIQKLGLPLIMEGVEKKEQSDALEALGVDMIQGYYYGKPMPETECLRYIRRMHLPKRNMERVDGKFMLKIAFVMMI